MTFPFGPLSIDPVEFASQGNAILGIRDSGKTYTATALAERLFDAGIPFFAFDPIGVWRYLRVPGAGRGYPVVVAGGKAPDLPLTVDNAAELTRQAMKAGVSVVFDFFDLHLSKADWRRIVTIAVKTMLHENHDLRHIFIEEAAEFIPQKVIDGHVYAELEKLARMGRNSRLGYTLINQRSQEVAKAILELCENVFLHRQRGSHAIQALDKWLQVAEATERRRIIKSLPDLPRGECWAWLGGDTPLPPQHIAVPEKNSLHPDARSLRGAITGPSRRPVDVAEFVARMQERDTKPTTPPAGKPAKTKEPEVTKDEADTLRRENADLKRQLAELRGRPTPASVALAPGMPDMEAIYDEVKRRLMTEAPALVRVLVEKPEIEVKVERKVIELDGTTLKGRLARLLANGFFDDGKTQGAARYELRRTGPDVNTGNLSKTFADLVASGFLTAESGSNYRTVEGMKVNIR